MNVLQMCVPRMCRQGQQRWRAKYFELCVPYLLDQGRCTERKHEQIPSRDAPPTDSFLLCCPKSADYRSLAPQAKLASLTSDKSAGQARAAALEAKLTRATEERRTRAKESREANESAAGRLSAAESRASEAEAMVQAVSRRLRASEGRLRAAETMATATIASATGTEEETGPAGEALSPVDANAMVKRETARGLVDTENAHFSLSSGVGGVRSQDDRVLAAHGALGRAAAAAQKLLRRKKAAEQRSDELDRALVDARRNHKHSSDKFLSPIARGSSFAQVAGMPAARKTVVRCATDEVGCNEIEILVRERNAADTRVVELENVLAEAHSRIRLLQHIQINTCNSDADRKEPQNREAHQANVCDVLHLTEAQHRFRKAEKEATESRTELDWAKAHVSTTTTNRKPTVESLPTLTCAR